MTRPKHALEIRTTEEMSRFAKRRIQSRAAVAMRASREPGR